MACTNRATMRAARGNDSPRDRNVSARNGGRRSAGHAHTLVGVWIWMKLPVPLRRAGYRTAYALLRLYWVLRRPDTRGVKCVLTHEDSVLLVQHTYGPRGWDLPGGSMHSAEQPLAAARREIHEELGLKLEDWRSVGAITFRADGRRDTLHCFAAQVTSREIDPDPGELAHTRWFPLNELPARLNRNVRAIVGFAS